MKDLVYRSILLTVGILLIGKPAAAADHNRFEHLLLSEAFYSEGVSISDINGDGTADIVSGPRWYKGPDFRRHTTYAPNPAYAISGYSNFFFTFTYDFNSDGRTDILAIQMPGEPAYWYENIGDSQEHWPKHEAFNNVGGESPAFTDITGDGRPELICVFEGAFGYATPNSLKPYEKWEFTPMTPDQGLGRFTHGMGIGDVDGDGRKDLLETNGWWKQSPKSGELFEFHKVKFAQSGGAQMFAYDFDGDGDNDVLSTQNAHGWGLTWFERRGTEADFLFVPHPILTDNPHDKVHGLAISQMHAIALEDIDGDGIKDIITGKRYWAHGGRDPGANQTPSLYWFRTLRSDSKVQFIPSLIGNRIGVGTQIAIGDISGDGKPDIAIGNKLGTSVAINKPEFHQAIAPVEIGTDRFAKHVRETEALSPEDELRSFNLPIGFEAQLVASEPDIGKPMNLAFDAQGRLWVSNSLEYPYPAREANGARDTIKILEDTTGDGLADKITTFADGLNIPMGLYPYRDGVICFSIPNIWFLRDTDGDGKADKREILYGPMGFEKDTHGMCNAFTRGFDGWLHACHGFNNQTTVAGRDGHQVSMTSGNTFRMQPDGSRIEHFTHGQVNPFGMAFNPSGDLFTADCHTKPITLLMKGGFYQSFGKPHDGLGFVPDVMEHLHGSTAIGGIALYHDNVFPQVYHGNAFGGNVMTSRINRNSLHHDGSTIRAQEEPDFLVSADPWFRPVDLQIGPDGAMYVADFYNRIIGHYEVPLDHPGRDRTRGRIWRIVYKGSDRRRDTSSNRSTPLSTLEPKALDSLIEELSSPSLTRRQLASDSIAELGADKASRRLRSVLRYSDSSHARAHALWLLFRLNQITSEDVTTAVNDTDFFVRRHSMSVIGSSNGFDQTSRDSWLQKGLNDSNATVRRAAVMATAEHPSRDLVKPLIDRYQSTPPNDRHLRHALLLALRNHLKNEAWFAAAAKDIRDEDVPLIANICLALKNEIAVGFIVSHIDRVSSEQNFDEHLTLAAQYVAPEETAVLVSSIERKFEGDVKFQRKMLESIYTGLRQRGVSMPPPVRQWAINIVCDLFDDGNEESQPIAWTNLSHPKARSKENPWKTSTRRQSADGQANSLLYSSFPSGEKLTGIYRSQIFILPSKLSFYVAGHDGFPDKSPQGNNFVRLHDAQTGKVLQQATAPRNDTAQLVSWNLSDFAGQSGYIELHDGDSATAYAWIAAGRFSLEGLNPSDVIDRRREAAELVGRYKLAEFHEKLQQMLTNEHTDRETLAIVAESIAKLQPDSSLFALATATQIANLPTDVLSEIAAQIAGLDGSDVGEVLGKALRIASFSEQFSIAQQLSSDKKGASKLIALTEAGIASRRLLLEPGIKQRLDAVLSDSDKTKAIELTSGIPDQDTLLAELLSQRKASMIENPGRVEPGRAVFTLNCASCHQIAGKGQQVGPNLDGIGNRGIDRLAEDILIPNQNVDVAFHASTVLTEDGTVHSGLIREIAGAVVKMIDNRGKQIVIPLNTIEQQEKNGMSPMPSNFHEVITPEGFRDLLAYLLSLR